LTAQTPEFTEELRVIEDHPALSPKSKAEPIAMWFSRGAQPNSEYHLCNEVRICPPGTEEVVSYTRWKRSAAMIYQGEMKAGKWAAPPKFMGYLTTDEVRYMANVMERMEQDV
jgi:hypothetical protein